MAKISPAKKAEFAEKSENLKTQIDDLTKKIQDILKTINKEPDLTNYKKLIVANNYMNIVICYLQLSTISMETLGIRNETYLEKARKLCYKFISVLEEIVGNYVDVPFNEIKEKLDTISQIDDTKRFSYIKKIGTTISLVEETFGPNSKWKWSFVDLDARASALCKNLTDLRRIQENQDPRIPGFQERNELLRYIKDILRKAADRLREKYEIATLESSELKAATRYLGALMRIAILFNDGEEANNLKKNIKIWEEKMEQDQKKMDEEKKQKIKK